MWSAVPSTRLDLICHCHCPLAASVSYLIVRVAIRTHRMDADSLFVFGAIEAAAYCKNGTSDPAWHSWSVVPSPVCLNALKSVLLTPPPPTSLNCELWPMSFLPEHRKVRSGPKRLNSLRVWVVGWGGEWCRGSLSFLSARCSFSPPAWPLAFTCRNWVYLKDWSSSSGAAPLTCSLSMELKSSPGRLLVASDPVIGGVNPRQVYRELSFQTAMSPAPTPIGCSPPTHICIRTDSELSEREMDSLRKG